MTTAKLHGANILFDAVKIRMSLKNDAALSRFLQVAPPVISKIRHGLLPVGASMLLNLHEKTNISIKELKYLLGQPTSEENADYQVLRRKNTENLHEASLIMKEATKKLVASGVAKSEIRFIKTKSKSTNTSIIALVVGQDSHCVEIGELSA